MCFPKHPFGGELRLFPKHEDVRRYLQEYAEDLREKIRFNTRVTDARKNGEKWEVKLRDEKMGSEWGREYDALVVAAGHYNIPFIPAFSGMEEWNRKYPGRIIHSKSFRTVEEYAGKRVVVVGNSASGYDIAMHLAPVVSELWQSIRTQGSPVADDKIRVVPEISRFVPETGEVCFIDGTVLGGVDAVVFCTGYLHSLPWLHPSGPPLITNGNRMQNTYQHIFYAPDATLSFVGLPIKVIPFPTMQSQAAVISRVYSRRIQLPGIEEMRRWEKEEVLKKGNGKGFSFYGYPADAEYLDELERMCDQAGEGGLEPVRWREWERWVRPRVAKIKASFVEAKREGKTDVRTMEELGWVFEENKEPKEAARPWVT